MPELPPILLAGLTGLISGLLLSIPVGPINLTILNDGTRRGFSTSSNARAEPFRRARRPSCRASSRRGGRGGRQHSAGLRHRAGRAFGEEGEEAAQQGDQREGAQAGDGIRLAFAFHADEQADAEGGGEGLDRTGEIGIEQRLDGVDRQHVGPQRLGVRDHVRQRRLGCRRTCDV